MQFILIFFVDYNSFYAHSDVASLCLFLVMQILPLLGEALRFTTRGGTLVSRKPLLRMQILVHFQNHLQQKGRRNFWSFFKTKLRLMMRRKPPRSKTRAMKWKLKQLYKTCFQNLHKAPHTSQGSTLCVVVREA